MNAFYFVFWLGIQHTVWTKSGECGYLCLVPVLRGRVSSFSPLRMKLASGLSLTCTSLVCKIKLMMPASPSLNSMFDAYFTIHETHQYSGVQFGSFRTSYEPSPPSIIDQILTPERDPEPLPAPSHFLPNFLNSWQPLVCFSSLWICLFWTLHVNRVIQDVMLCV